MEGKARKKAGLVKATKNSLKKAALSSSPQKKQRIEKKTKLATKLIAGGPKKSIKIRDNTRSVPKTQAVVVRSKVELALLSPFRFPLPQERMVGTVARYAGVFFVAVGALFSLIHLESAGGAITHTDRLSHRAQTVSSTLTGTTAPVDPVTSNTSSFVADTTPDVRVALEGANGSTISSMVPVMVTVPLATEVKIAVENIEEDSVIALGSAFRVDNSTWRFYWDTRQYPNSAYKVRVVVKNQYGSYEHNDSTTYTVENITPNTPPTPLPPSGAGTSTSSLGTSTASTTPPPPPAPTSTVPSANLEVLESSPLVGGAPIKITTTSSASEVRVYARNVNSTNLFSIGSARLQPSGEWRIDWNTMLVVDGEYRIHAKVKLTNGTYVETGVVTKEVKNGVTAATTPPVMTTSTAPITVAPATTTAPADGAVVPSIVMRLGSPSPVSGSVDVLVKTSEVQWVEIFAVNKSTLTPLFLGLAQKISNTEWKYAWSTKQSPNGEYNVYARVKTNYGFTEGARIPVKVFNEVIQTFTETQDKTIDILTDVASELIHPTDGTEEEGGSGETYTPPKMVYIEPVKTFASKVETDDDAREHIEERLTDFRTALNSKLNELARALREEDEDKLENVKREIEALKSEVIRELSAGGVEKKAIIDSINAYLSQITFELEEITTKNEAILKERIGDAVVKDSDKDGILDYDEINLYRTNPFAADTDGDSYIDSVEIRLGYDPHDSKSESLLNYESPKETGVVREDLLEVSSITTLSDTEKEATNIETPAPTRAMISGKGLPNSFVTLYIYSTPIILTVKTDAEGSWSYVFDKELEQGNHEVYVGITDNAGRVVAKSNPLPFVKTAEAYAEESALAQVSNSEGSEPALVSEEMMLLVASMAVVGLGLVLILLGFHVRGRQEPDMIVQNA